MSSSIEILQIKLEELKSKLDDVKVNLLDKQSDLESIELCPDDFITEYEDCLNECNGAFMGMDASYILKQLDNTAYRCGLMDYVDTKDVTECEEYKELEQEIEELESDIEDLENEIYEIQEELEELENEE